MAFKVKFQVRFEDPAMESRFGELQASMLSAVNQIWKQKLGGIFSGRTFTIAPSFVLVNAKANRDKDSWLITVRKASTGPITPYPGCNTELPGPSVPTSFTDPMCDGGVMSIPPSHISKPDVLGHEILHLFGLIDRYMMFTEEPPKKAPGKAATQKPKVTLLPVRETHGRPDPLAGQTGSVLSEDLGFLFDKFGVYKQEEARSTQGLYSVRREVMRLREIIELGYDPNSLIRYREDFRDKMIKDAENL